jgi:hypothetical protein
MEEKIAISNGLSCPANMGVALRMKKIATAMLWVL